MTLFTSAIERFEHYTARIERFNGDLNAFLDLRPETARMEAVASDIRRREGKLLSPIDGWCIGIKANIAVRGLPHHAGIAAYRNDIADEDAETVRRLKQAGAVILGTLNMHEGALGATTDNAAFGRTHNPWKEGYTPGGSSGGSGAAVAAGLCDAALGSDTMGSVRIPSAYCGCQGFKPSLGKVSNAGVLALSDTLDTIGPHAMSASALAEISCVLTGHVLEAEPATFGDLRFAVWDGTGGTELGTDVEEGFRAAIEGLERTGATHTGKVSPEGYLYGKSRRAGLVVSEVEGARIHAARMETDPSGFSAGFLKLLRYGQKVTEADMAAALEQIASIRDGAARAFAGCEIILAPVAPQTAFSFDADVPANQADFTAWANFAGLPAAASGPA